MSLGVRHPLILEGFQAVEISDWGQFLSGQVQSSQQKQCDQQGNRLYAQTGLQGTV